MAGRTPSTDLVLVADLTQPCHVCGIACSGTVLFWFLRAGVRHAIEVDRPTLDELFEKLPRGEGRELPAILRDHAAGTGWYGSEASPTGTPIAYAELAALLALTDEAGLDEHERRICEALRSLAAEAAQAAAPMFVYDD
ncbi:hypothetical protein [Nannocystis pusilla]|uniref:hypothetical protein n=1 Tax=Nannocystis pusilla TaxID=889268 RepID=UPI003BF3F070